MPFLFPIPLILSVNIASPVTCLFCPFVFLLKYNFLLLFLSFLSFLPSTPCSFLHSFLPLFFPFYLSILVPLPSYRFYVLWLSRSYFQFCFINMYCIFVDCLSNSMYYLSAIMYFMYFVWFVSPGWRLFFLLEERLIKYICICICIWNKHEGGTIMAQIWHIII